jgi:hypothetical protein
MLPTFLISQGSGGHSYVFAELAYRVHLWGFNVFIMPKHGGRTVNQLVSRHLEVLQYIRREFNDRIGLYGEGLALTACLSATPSTACRTP